MNRSLLRVALPLLAGLASAACLAERHAFMPKAPDAGRAAIVVYRPESWTGKLREAEVFLNGKPAGVLKNATYKRLDVEPGNNAVRVKWGVGVMIDETVQILTEPGKIYFVRAASSKKDNPATNTYLGHIQVVAPGTGAAVRDVSEDTAKPELELCAQAH